MRTISNFNFHAKCERSNITYLALADDLMLFYRGDQRSLKILSNVMEEFSARSGLEINKDESNLFVGGVHGRELEELKQVFEFPLEEFPIKYLGIPLASVKLNAMHYSPLIERISNATNKWIGKNLSFAGKVELIRSVL